MQMKWEAYYQPLRFSYQKRADVTLHSEPLPQIKENYRLGIQSKFAQT